MGMLRGVRHTEELYKFSRKNEGLEKLTILFIFSYSNFNRVYGNRGTKVLIEVPKVL